MKSSGGGKAGIVAALLAGVVGSVVLIKPWEGKRNVGYADIIGIPTDCYGNTHGARIGVYRTDAECELMLTDEVKGIVATLDDCITTPIPPGAASAVISLAYNVGAPSVCKSTLVRKINAGQPPAEYCPELLRWNKAGGIEVRGLTNRRKAELKVCLGG
jgi:lysozyme